jgi:hypothetical protein
MRWLELPLKTRPDRGIAPKKKPQQLQTIMLKLLKFSTVSVSISLKEIGVCRLSFSLFQRFYPVAEETVDAENFVNKANAFMNDGTTILFSYFASRAPISASRTSNVLLNALSPVEVSDYRLRLRYKMQHGSVMDSNRKFNEAALTYHELSQSPPSQIKADDLLVLLGKAVTCAILGKASFTRSTGLEF